MMKYRKKPLEVEAFIMGIDDIPDWFMDKVTSNEIILSRNVNETYCYIKTLEGTMKADYGDYIIKGINGEVYPCKPDIFEKTYEISLKTVNYNNIYEKAINTYGENAQLDMVIEEMSELTKEICKKKRGKHNSEEIIEEIADVEIMIEQLKIICNVNCTQLENVKYQKITRLEERLNNVY